MGYEFRHARWEKHGRRYEAYKIRNDEHPVLQGPPQLQDN